MLTTSLQTTSARLSCSAAWPRRPLARIAQSSSLCSQPKRLRRQHAKRIRQILWRSWLRGMHPFEATSRLLSLPLRHQELSAWMLWRRTSTQSSSSLPPSPPTPAQLPTRLLSARLSRQFPRLARPISRQARLTPRLFPRLSPAMRPGTPPRVFPPRSFPRLSPRCGAQAQWWLLATPTWLGSRPSLPRLPLPKRPARTQWRLSPSPRLFRMMTASPPSQILSPTSRLEEGLQLCGQGPRRWRPPPPPSLTRSPTLPRLSSRPWARTASPWRASRRTPASPRR